MPSVRRHLADGHTRARDFARQSKQLEVALAQVKGKLYGSSYVVRRPWASIWEEVEREFTALQAQEMALVDDLAPHLDADHREALAERIYRAEHKVPTRPHPYLPHRGLAGRVARGVAVRIDRFWDTAEGRMVPEPVRPSPKRTGPITQYLLADPHMRTAGD